MEDKNKIEAILFITGKFLSVSDISNMTGIKSEEFIKETLNVRKEYLHLTDNLLSDTELDRPTQETLAIVAYKNPVLQSEVIKIRGNKAYDHIKILKEEGFITSEKSGRTRLLKLTPKFFEYFDVVEDNLKLKNEKE